MSDRPRPHPSDRLADVSVGDLHREFSGADDPSVEACLDRIRTNVPASAREPEPIVAPHALIDFMTLYVTAVTGSDGTLGPNGRQICSLLADVGGAHSPGTVYPALADLYEAGILDREELVRTKQYYIADREAVRSRLATIEAELLWWAALAKAGRVELEAREAEATP